MNSAVIQLLVLAGVAIFLILRLKSVLGTRDGFEKPRVNPPTASDAAARRRGDFEVIEGGPDHDITDHAPDGSDTAKALAAMKLAEPGLNVREFLEGARGAYEMILMAFERGELDEVKPFLDDDVYESFEEVIDERKKKGLSVDANFVGVREISLAGADYDRDSQEGEITVRFVGELTSVLRNEAGEVIEGNPNEIKRQKDIWTFARVLGKDDPNWQLVATGE